LLIGGIQKNSLIDYPGKMSCVIFLAGCNFDCPYCHNPDLARGRAPRGTCLTKTDVYDFLERRLGLLDGVVISGGEPTLSPGLASLCGRIREMGYPVKLDTNGSRPDVLRGLLDMGLLDYVAMDVKTSPARYGLLTRDGCRPSDILASIRLIMDRSGDYEFRTTCVRPLVGDEIIESIARAVHGAGRYVLQRFHPGEVLHPDFFKDQDPAFDDEDLVRFQALAAPWVQECLVR
jgi:pyruvate formate lyase activating enzyme